MRDKLLLAASVSLIAAIIGHGIGVTRDFAPIQGNDLRGVTLQGKPTIHDGDTLRVAGSSVRLHGVDAEELNEPHGYQSRDALIKIINGAAVRCALTGERSYNRVVGECFLPDGTDVGAELIRRGLALDCGRYSRGKYRALEPVNARRELIQKGYC